ncbi:hypothetical protein PF005_g27517 [Phytophthora fragariae]|uniref:Uncharacterized protein n=1 Tax=Phytophthora fragariae TaxID=53985 RepID=A0A6A3QKD3_9STRA|nr:hypothetical protein PF003_g38943 [Phytophthora fragariae]KAE8921383.1 hypothetical protein PF009_g28341 [Phytophthora fragariae]KAE8969602.1 hypothetical protein PF011_g26743 [Phytophthora fragariae]KAE9068412.1 hypothetical protein PF007_g27698 [Phytophthora fragariae]KAE9069349.1 hypothetical protein PF010_g26697 [Phytophthora fragariae]
MLLRGTPVLLSGVGMIQITLVLSAVCSADCACSALRTLNKHAGLVASPAPA